jgi:hypothetical protein
LGKLPVFQGEIPPGSVIIVGHTVFHMLRFGKSDGSQLGFGLQWVVVLATPN